MLKLKDLRKQRKLSQAELAEMIGVTQVTMGRYESGEREMPYQTLFQLSDFFGVSIDELLGRTNAKVTIVDGPAPVEPPKGTKRIVVDAQPKMSGAEQAEQPKTIQETIASLIDEALKKRGL